MQTETAADIAEPANIAEAEAKAAAASADGRNLRYARTLAKLIQVPTVSELGQTDFSQFEAFHQLLEETFPHLWSACEAEKFGAGLLLRWPGKNPDALPVMFMNHHDVVDPNGEWAEHGPFSGDIADGRVWGRGTLDTKSGLFGMMQAADELAAEGFTPACDVYFESACDEENDGVTCRAAIEALHGRGIRMDWCLDEGGYLVDDPMGFTPGTFAMAGVGEKPYVSLKFTAEDSGGHASTPGKKTALVRLGQFMADAEKHRAKLFPVELSPTIAEMLRRMAPSVNGPLKHLFAHPGLFRPLLKKVMPAVSATANALMSTTAAFTMAGGSDSPNVLPSQAWVIANMRCSHHQGKAASVKAITDLAAKHGLRAEMLEESVESPLSPYDSDAFRLLEEAVGRNYPGTVTTPYIMTGASDCRFASLVTDNCLRLCPFHITMEQTATIHSPNENIDIATLAAGVDTYRYLIEHAG